MEFATSAEPTSPLDGDDRRAYPSDTFDRSLELEYSPSSFDPEGLEEYIPLVDVEGTYAGSSGVPLYAPVPVSYHRSVLSLSEDDISTYFEGPFQSRSPYDATLPDDFKLTAAEEFELLDAYSVRDPHESSADYHAMADEASTENYFDGSLAPTLAVRDDNTPHVGDEAEDQVAEDRRVRRVLQRKAYFRATADNVGYNITDPDTITNHEKKRFYVECLEDYVVWLHEQIRLAGHEPLSMECVAGYRGLKIRSLRTILVHKQRELYSQNLEKIRAQDRFMELQAAIVAQEFSFCPNGPEVYRTTAGDVPQQHVHPFHS